MSGFQTDRFVVTFRDKSNNDSAFEKECIMDKTTGELLCKTQAGDTLSYDYYQRLNQTMNHFSYSAMDREITGDVFNVSPSSLSFPSLVTSGEELLDEPIVFIGDISRFALTADADVVISDTEENHYNKSYNDYTLTFTYTVYHLGTQVASETVILTKNDILSNFITLSQSYHATKLVISSIRIGNVLTDVNTVYKLVLNSILLFIQYNELVGLMGISIDTLPTKLTYAPNESLDLTGMVVNAYYSDDTYAPITDYTISGWDNRTRSSEAVITVSYQGFTDTFTVYIPAYAYIYIIDDTTNTVTILKYIGGETTVYVPTTIEGYPVTRIEASAFSYTNVTTVHIPNTVTTIG